MKSYVIDAADSAVSEIVVKQQKKKRDRAGKKAASAEVAKLAVSDAWKAVPEKEKRNIFKAAKQKHFDALEEADRVKRVSDLIKLCRDLDGVDINPVLVPSRSELLRIAKGKDFVCYFSVSKGNGVELLVKYDGHTLVSLSETGMGAKIMPWKLFVERYNCNLEKVAWDKFRGALDANAVDVESRWKSAERSIVDISANAIRSDFAGKPGFGGGNSKFGNAVALDLVFKKVEAKASAKVYAAEKKAINKAVRKGAAEWYK